MKTREFNIKTTNLDLEYELNLELIEEYIVEDLEVPQDYIESLEITNKYVHIKLAQTRVYFNDDWYVNLQRVA